MTAIEFSLDPHLITQKLEALVALDAQGQHLLDGVQLAKEVVLLLRRTRHCNVVVVGLVSQTEVSSKAKDQNTVRRDVSLARSTKLLWGFHM